MNISYKRELKHNYLIIVPEDSMYDTYEIRMVASNCIDGLLKLYVKLVDNRKSFYYEITSRQPLSRLLEHQSLGVKELQSLINGIGQTLGRLEAYLLEEGQILLEPDYIYVEPAHFTVCLCLIPGRRGNFPEEMTSLLQYLLGKVNHQDKDCVVMAYGLYQESLKENYGMEDLLKLSGRKWIEPGDGMSCESETAEVIAAETGEMGSYLMDREQPDQEGKNSKIGRERRSLEEITEWSKDQTREGMRDRTIKKTVNDEKRVQRKKVGRGLLILILLSVGGPAAIWFLYGKTGIRDYWLILVILDAVAAAYLVIQIVGLWLLNAGVETKEGSGTKRNEIDRSVTVRNEIGQYKKEAHLPRANRKLKETGDSDQEHGWQMMFQGEEYEGEEERREGGQEKEDEIGTVLLTEGIKIQGVRYLKGIDDRTKDIELTYIPFIIGKQEGLADYILNHDTVSRLHVRIDKEGDEYRITDLNSTNGTMVRGKVLETNETVIIMPGDEIYIANIGFIFT